MIPNVQKLFWCWDFAVIVGKKCGLSSSRRMWNKKQAAGKNEVIWVMMAKRSDVSLVGTPWSSDYIFWSAHVPSEDFRLSLLVRGSWYIVNWLGLYWLLLLLHRICRSWSLCTNIQLLNEKATRFRRAGVLRWIPLFWLIRSSSQSKVAISKI